MDLSGPFEESVVKNKHIALAVDQVTQRVFNYFLKRKGKLAGPMAN